MSATCKSIFRNAEVVGPSPIRSTLPSNDLRRFRNLATTDLPENHYRLCWFRGSEMKRGRTPTYPRKAHASGYARIRWRGKDKYFKGFHGTKESLDDFWDWKNGLEGIDRGKIEPRKPNERLTVRDVMDRYLKWAAEEYQRNQEFFSLHRAANHVCRLYGNHFADDFGPLKLKAVRDSLMYREIKLKDGTVRSVPRARSYLNTTTGRIRRIFAWAVENELVGPSVAHALESVTHLKPGRTKAQEPRKVEPVPKELVFAVLPHLSSVVAAMVKVLWIVGMRSGELCIMRGADLDMSGDEWVYRPHQHKTKRKGKELVYHLGKMSQDIIRPFLREDPSEYLFSPADSVAEFRAVAAAKRKTKRQPSQLARKPKRNPRKKPGLHYTSGSFRQAVYRGLGKLSKELEDAPVQTWHPHRVRHSVATELRRTYGLEGSKVSLGHANISATQHYAELDMELARRIARERG